MGCDRPAADSYLRAVAERLVEFSVCTDHHWLLLKGEATVIVAEDRRQDSH